MKTQSLKPLLPQTNQIESLSVVMMCVQNSHVNINAELLLLEKSSTPVVVITHKHQSQFTASLVAIYVFSAIETIEQKTQRAYSVVAEFSDRPAMCTEINGLSVTLQIIRDLVDQRANQLIDSSTRSRLDRFGDVTTPDTRELIELNRELSVLMLDECIQHENHVSLQDQSIVCVEQIGVDFEAATDVWRVSMIISNDLNWQPGFESSVDLTSFEDLCCVMEQLSAEAQERSMFDETSTAIS